ncbi:MAG TPA: serine hydrolase [Ferruginibacter sp.]|nr:serine hydrolase [Ferruginibacter sp.]
MKKLIITIPTLIFTVLAAGGQDVGKRIDSLIEKAVKLNRFNGSVLVSKNGKIVYEKSDGYQNVNKHILNTSNTIYQIGSTTKEFTAAVILKLAEQHKLSLEDKLSKYFPDYKRGDEITVKHLLTHTSGISEILRDHTAVNESAIPRSIEKTLSYFINKPLDFDPGTRYSYSNSGYILLGLIIEKVTGQTYQLAVREFILKPLKMNHTGFDFAGLRSSYKAMGYTKYTQLIHEESIPWDSTATFSAGSLYSTVKDLYKWHQGLLNYKVYSKASLQEATTPFLEGYGLGCWIDTLYTKKIVSHGGNILGFTGYFGRIQEDDVCVILLNNIYNHQIETIGLSIFAILYNKPYSYFDEIKLSAELLEKYAGEYEVNADYKVKIIRTGDQLFIQRNNKPEIEIFAYKENGFFQKDDDIRISFQMENNIITQITIREGLNTKKGDKIKLKQ